MQKTKLTILLVMLLGSAQAQSRFPTNEISINGFRAPCMGLEYRLNHTSVHAGYYLTAFHLHETTHFVKAGVTYWFLPVGKKKIPSSFYTGVDYMRGLDHGFANKNAAGVEAGFRWMIWKGLNVRLGSIAVMAKDRVQGPPANRAHNYYCKGQRNNRHICQYHEPRHAACEPLFRRWFLHGYYLRPYFLPQVR